MKIVYDDSVYLIPEKNIINIISGKFQKNLTECFDMYFNKKKKNFCKIYDGENNEVSNDEVSFIYFPFETNFEQNFILKPKTFLNNEISSFIEQNPLEFTSFEHIRNFLLESSTDRGMFRLKKILGQNINSQINIDLNHFEICHLLSMLEINTDDLTFSDCYKILYNLALFKSRNTYSIVYVDFPIFEQDLEWFQHYSQNNILFLISNDCLHCDITDKIKEFSMILLSNQNFMEVQEYDLSQFNINSYLQNDFVVHHLSMQTEKNIRLFKEFNDKNTTFYLIFRDYTPLKLL